MVPVSAKSQKQPGSAARDDSAGRRHAGPARRIRRGPAMGTVLEAKLDRGRGPVATVLVRNGTLKVGDYFICGSVFGRVRAMFDDRGAADARSGRRPCRPRCSASNRCPKSATRSRWLRTPPRPSRSSSIARAKRAKWRCRKTNRITLEQLHDQLKEGEIKDLNIILKTDVGGTAEVLTDTMQKLSNEKVRIRVLHSRRGRHHRNGRAAGVGFRGRSSSASTSGRSATRRRSPNRKRSTSGCTPSFTNWPTK